MSTHAPHRHAAAHAAPRGAAPPRRRRRLRRRVAPAGPRRRLAIVARPRAACRRSTTRSRRSRSRCATRTSSASRPHDKGLDPALIAGVIYAESHFRDGQTSSAGAQGLMQLTPGTRAYIAAQVRRHGVRASTTSARRRSTSPTAPTTCATCCAATATTSSSSLRRLQRGRGQRRPAGSQRRRRARDVTRDPVPRDPRLRQRVSTRGRLPAASTARARAVAPQRRSEEDLVGRFEAVEGDGFLVGVDARAVDAGEQAAVGGWGDGAFAFDDEEVGPGGFEDVAVAVEKDGVGAQRGGQPPVGPFVAAEASGEEIGLSAPVSVISPRGSRSVVNSPVGASASLNRPVPLGISMACGPSTS